MVAAQRAAPLHPSRDRCAQLMRLMVILIIVGDLAGQTGKRRYAGAMGLGTKRDFETCRDVVVRA